jgi:hypothetical protein
MKQAELNKLLNAELRRAAKAHDWKCSGGYLFKATDLLFFMVGILGRAQQRHLSYSLSFKWLAFDDLFWKIVKLDENRKQPLSFRAAGAWTAPVSTVSESKLSISDWSAECIHVGIDEIITRCEGDAAKICDQVHGLDDNLRVVESLHVGHKETYPKSNKNIWMERMLTAILKNDYREAEKIVRDRKKCRDDGGFLSGNQSFYQLADEYVKTLTATEN